MNYAVIAVILVSITACNDSDPGSGPGNSGNSSGGGGWSISSSEVFDGGPGKDGIPALTMPEMVSVNEASYLKDDDLVVGYKRGDDVRAYPHPILDWHEIINDEVDSHPIAIIYCPLTGTGTGWERTINGEVTTFGVSGLLYNTNIIPYDRLTGSNWSQIRLDCVNGELRGETAKTFHVVETTWKTWREMFPQTKVVSTKTGFSRNYGLYPYGAYKTNHSSFLFPFEPKDGRLPAKERVLGVIIKGKAKVYTFGAFDAEVVVYEDNFNGTDLVIAGSQVHNFMVAFERRLEDGTILSFSPAPFAQGVSSVILHDNEGNTWDIFGNPGEVSRTGQRLTPVISFIGYWFSWGAFYPSPEIFE
ncbi:MAG: DUF3179 domain-containing protein [Cyclobacteriaceae bacterium]